MLFISTQVTPKPKYMQCGWKNSSCNLECSHNKVFLDQNFEEDQYSSHHFLNSFPEFSHLSMLLFHQFKDAAQEIYFQTQNKTLGVTTEIINLGVFFFISFKYHSGYVKLYLISASCLHLLHDTCMQMGQNSRATVEFLGGPLEEK